jgi:hypothetical protein
MLQDRGPERLEGGDRFYTRESPTPPQLLIDFQGGNAADLIFDNIEQDNGTSNPESNSTTAGEIEGPAETPAPSTFVNGTSADSFSNATGGGETGVEENPTEEETTAPGDGEIAGVGQNATEVGQNTIEEETTLGDTTAPSVVPAVRRRRT